MHSTVTRHAHDGTEPRVDAARMLRTLEEISRFGSGPEPGLTRLGLGAAETAARRYLAERCRRDGLVTHVDEAGNLIVRRRAPAAGRPVVLLGSHLDTVVQGGRLDGTYGVIAACEVLRVLGDAAGLRYEPVAVAFSNEEGAGVPYPFFGSLALTGQVDLSLAEQMHDRDGRPLRTVLRAAGGDLDAIGAATWPSGSIAYYLELHIEQGPALEARQVPIGVVEAITGRTVIDVTVRGEQGHAGTTPMSLRRDALTTAARVVLAVEELAADRCATGTVGRLEVLPGATNVIPGEVRLTAEIRDGDAGRLHRAEEILLTRLSGLGAATGVTIEAEPRRLTDPVRTDAAVRDAITRAADDLGLAHLDLYSGAGHDAQIVASAAPIGMIFVPSRRGISHAPHEHTDDIHLTAGADTLLRTVLRLASDQ